MEDLKNPYVPTWCIGCGNYGIWNAWKKALMSLDLDPEQTALVTGIGCSSKIAQYLNTYRIETLHGRSLPVATGVKLANHQLTVIAEGGDGDGMGLGIGHFIHTARRNLDITYMIHNNQIYGLTKGQSSPTSDLGTVTKFTPPPRGNVEQPINIVQTALQAGASFVARSTAADPKLAEIIAQAIQHKGFSVIDILQPCVSFNQVNTYKWYQERVYAVADLSDYDPTDYAKAAAIAVQWGDKIPIGVIYAAERMTYEASLPQLAAQTLSSQSIEPIIVTPLMDELA
ncbi:2-oxoacid:ferredoxin oxidoreductase subunit beta [bacterium BFN5]|nr:2-oxoacid:ferredoxin oxidoreductase subunit beta [bacterium BFN5]